MKVIYFSGLIIFAIGLSGCADNSGPPGPYDGDWSYNSEKTLEIQGDSFSGLTDSVGNSKWENLNIRNNRYQVNFPNFNITYNCEIIGDTSEGNCLDSETNEDDGEGHSFSIVDGSLYIVEGSGNPYVLDRQ